MMLKWTCPKTLKHQQRPNQSMTRHTDTHAKQRQKREPGGGIILSYKVSSWVFLRLYGAAFCWFAWIMWTSAWTPVNLLNYWPEALPYKWFYGTLAALGVLLIFPFFTPSPLRFPRTVSGGVVKAILLLILSGILYVLTLALLDGGYLRYSQHLSSTLPLMIKAVAGLSVTGAVLVSLAGALHDSKAKRPKALSEKMSDEDLRALRRARSQA